MYYSNIFKFYKEKKWLYITRENSNKMESKYGVYLFDSDNFEFKKLSYQTDIPEYKYHSSITFC